MKVDSKLLIPQGGKLGKHTLIEHLNEYRGVGYPVGRFECGKCGNTFKTTLKTAQNSASCGCAKKRYNTSINVIVDMLKNDPFIRIIEISSMLNIPYGRAQKYRVEAFKIL